MILEVKKATFKYDTSDSTIFNDISLSIDTGEVFCILGPNGVGKTSLLKCIAGLLPTTQGEILCKGKPITKISRLKAAKTIAYVPQIHYPVFAYSVFDTVLMGRTPYLGYFAFPDPNDEQITRNAIESMGITHLSKKPYTEISGGERQLVMFARALAQEPKVIILDEPTSHLDYGNQIKILSLIYNLSRQKVAVIMTSHNPDHAFMIADKVGIMFDQHIYDIDTPQTIITEETLSKIYGIQVKLRKDNVFGKICVPKLNKQEIPCRK